MSIVGRQLFRVFWTNILNPQSSVHYVNQISRRWAGHSKWSNIKHTKMLKDSLKSVAIERINRKIALAIREGGDNPTYNSKLRAAIEEAKKNNIPNSSIETTLRKAKYNLNQKPYWLIYSSNDGLLVGFEVACANPITAISKINGYCKRYNLKYEKGGINTIEERGIIICEPVSAENNYDKAVEDAILFGAEEVSEIDDKMFLFQCTPSYLENISKKLEENGYNVQSATTEIEFHDHVKLSDDWCKQISTLLERVEEKVDDVIRIANNIKQE